MNNLLKRSKKNLKKFTERCVRSSEKSGFVSRSSLNFFPFPFYPLYAASRGFSLAWLLAFTKSFASLVSRVVGLFVLPWRIKQTNCATHKQRERLRKRSSRAREKLLLAG